MAHFDSPEGDELSRPPVGVIGVLKWAAAATVLFFAVCVLLQLGYCIAAERAMSHAARAGVLEATLPRATRQSVVETIERRLAGHSMSTGALHITLQRNNAAAERVLRLADNDRVCVVLSVPADAVIPAWLRAVNFLAGDSRIEARAEQHMPGRLLEATADKRR